MLPLLSRIPPRPVLWCALVGVCLLLPSPSRAQETSEFERLVREEQAQQAEDALVTEPEDSAEELEEEFVLPEEPITPREELFLAIELKDVEAARQVLERGAASEINRGDPSPLATAALHNDLRMVVLLLEAGGDPGATLDSPLEEAVRNESTRMVELFMRSGGQVPAGEAGQELFRLAQRGETAQELSRILLDHGADAGQCLAAATAQARVELMKYCLSRGADVSSLPVAMNVLGVAIASGDTEIVERILAGNVTDPMLISAFTDAVVGGKVALVERALAAGAMPAFKQVEAAIESGQPEICLLLLGHSPPDDPSVLRGGDVEGLIQRASDLGFADVAVALKSKSGLSSWKLETWLPVVLGSLLVIGLIGLLLNSFSRRGRTSSAGLQNLDYPVRSASRSRPAGGSRPAPTPGPAARNEAAAAPVVADPGRQPSVGSAAVGAAAVGSTAAASASVNAAAVGMPVSAVVIPPAPESAAGPAIADLSPAATLPIGAIPMMPSMPQAAPAQPVPAAAESVAAPAAAASESNVWQLAPEPEIESQSGTSSAHDVAAVAARPGVEVRMPDVDLSRDAEAVFQAARQASSGETVRPDAPDRRQVVLVTPSRVTMLRSCPAPGSLAPGQLAAAEELAGTSPARNVAAIAYNDLDTMGDDIAQAIPFFELLRQLGYLGHAVWIFEGHLSAMAAGCRDADILIVDDGMVPYLPGNWRSVATRVMRGSDVHIFERKTGSLRRL